MIFGVGVDIVQTSRMKKWVADKAMLRRFFNPAEMMGEQFGKPSSEPPKMQPSQAMGDGHSLPGGDRRIARLCEYYAVRFAAKEAFSKALGTGLSGFALRDVFVTKDSDGKPALVTVDSALTALEKRCAGAKVFVSLSHEKEYAVAFVVIDRGE